MVKVCVLQEQGTPVGFQLSGHAGCGAYGEDLACAGVSAIVQTALLGITEVLHLDAAIRRQEGDVYCILSREVSPEEKERAAIVFATMEAGLVSLRQAYPQALKFSYREV